MDASDREMSTAVLIRFLREVPDPPVDMVAAERSLYRCSTGRSAARVASVIVLLALVACVITGLDLWGSPEEAPLPARQLQSGLPMAPCWAT